MSLLSTIQLASNSLAAAQVGLQVSGNNIANADTPGYVRQEAVFEPAPITVQGNLPLGSGVRVAEIVRTMDRFLADRLRSAIADLEGSEAKQQAYLQLETVLAELGDTDLSTALTSFFGSIHDVLNQPEDVAIRHQAVLQGESLASGIRRLGGRVAELRSDMNGQIRETTGEINQRLEEIAELNGQIVQIEASTSGVEAVGLRDQRELALQELAGLIGARAVETESGSVSVFAGGDFLVLGTRAEPVAVSESLRKDFVELEVVIEKDDAPLATNGGKLAGLYAARDEVLDGFADQLADFVAALTFEFNKVHSSGQGLTGYQELISLHAVTDSSVSLDQAGLASRPVNGSFQIRVRNLATSDVRTSDVTVDLNGLDDDTSLTELALAIDAIDGMSATVSASGQLRLSTDSEDLDFSFAKDTSGALAALGLNVFFTGSNATDLGVNSLLLTDPAKLAASSTGVGLDADNAAALAGFANQSLEDHQGKSISDLYDALVVSTTQASAVQQAVTDGFRLFQRTLESQYLGTTGVSIDDEAVKMITHQRIYQASARVISSIADLLDALMNL